MNWMFLFAQTTTPENIGAGLRKGATGLWGAGKSLLGMGKGAVGIGGMISAKIMVVITFAFNLPQDGWQWALFALFAIPLLAVPPLRRWIDAFVHPITELSQGLARFFGNGLFGALCAAFVLWQSPPLFIVILVFLNPKVAQAIITLGLACMVARSPGVWYWIPFGVLCLVDGAILALALVAVIKHWQEFKAKVASVFSGGARYWTCTAPLGPEGTPCGYALNPVSDNNGESKGCAHCGSRNHNAPWRCGGDKVEMEVEVDEKGPDGQPTGKKVWEKRRVTQGGCGATNPPEAKWCTSCQSKPGRHPHYNEDWGFKYDTPTESTTPAKEKGRLRQWLASLFEDKDGGRRSSNGRSGRGSQAAPAANDSRRTRRRSQP